MSSVQTNNEVNHALMAQLKNAVSEPNLKFDGNVKPTLQFHMESWNFAA